LHIERVVDGDCDLLRELFEHLLGEAQAARTVLYDDLFQHADLEKLEGPALHVIPVHHLIDDAGS
jgi:hypothetical protein